ncbi:MAG: hypothetical protein CFH19_00910 [Alphaproteobacteria bacterium MarineAlpha5_Bin9]|nr:MAG: hypothetical protein CFH19_00910 [Alphaproteobacteria bacterium MarineAlpha5_Bin9]|tara:strand:- start:1692 stop:1826 length:135 start_codon:yes stop_codon:yes gene_type:complete
MKKLIILNITISVLISSNKTFNNKSKKEDFLFRKCSKCEIKEKY